MLQSLNIRETNLGVIKYKNDFRLLIDGDMLLYKAAWATNTSSFTQARLSFLFTIYRIFDALDSDDYLICLSSSESHRKEVYPLYKANRSGAEKPIHLAPLRKFVQNIFECTEISGFEADDIIAQYHDRDKTIIVSKDKDFNQLVGFHYNYDKTRESLYWVDQTEAHMFRSQQLLTGDRIDNIPGLSERAPKRGIGEARARKLLGEWVDVETAFDIVLKAYENKYGETDALDLIHLNGYLLHLGLDTMSWKEELLETYY